MKRQAMRVLVCAAVVCATAGCGSDPDGEKRVTKSGARYVDVVEGTGPEANHGDFRILAYKAYLSDGKLFQEKDREHPATLRAGFKEPILGLDEAMDGMKVGGKRKIWVPAKAAYGTHGSPPLVPPNADLYFEVELIGRTTGKDLAASKEKADKAEEAARKKASSERMSELTKPESGKDVPEAERKEVTTPEGLKYVDERIGEGREAIAGNKIVVHYTGKLTNGQTFDSSRTRNQPFSVELGRGQVIRGWDVGIVGMRAGGKRKLIIPPELGYGSKGTRGIPPNSTLVFDVELLKVF